MERQVLQVKRKNSTNCNCPDARVTLEGSVASRSGPRDVATITGAGKSVATTRFPVTTTSGAWVGERLGTWVLTGDGTTDVGTDAGVAGAQATSRTNIKVNTGKIKIWFRVDLLLIFHLI
jgi:hypothetical protein